jgi:prepilin-type N-terminal cleavage/methylation domain-containing protein
MQREHFGARGAQPEEEGFTLLELMMVILIIAILIAVMIPMFVGATSRAKDRAMQTSLTTAVTGAKTLYLANADYTTATPAALTTETGGVTFIAGATAPTGQNSVSVFPVSISQLVVSGLSKSGSCFYILDNETSGTTVYAKLPGAGGCAASGAPLPSDPAWKSAW